MMNLQSLVWDNWSDVFSSVTAILIFTAVLIFPVLIWVILWKKFKFLSEEKSVNTFGSIYAELRTDSKYAVLYNVFYVSRRLLFAVIAILFPSVPFLQVQALIFHCILLIIYDTLVKPFTNPLLNKLEVFNEVCIIGASYHLLLFTDYVQDDEMQYNGGWSIIAITTLNIVVNMIVMLIQTIKRLCLNIKKMRQKIRDWLDKRAKAKKEASALKYGDNQDPNNASQLNAIDQTQVKFLETLREQSTTNLTIHSIQPQQDIFGFTTDLQDHKSKGQKGKKRKSKKKHSEDNIPQLMKKSKTGRVHKSSLDDEAQEMEIEMSPDQQKIYDDYMQRHEAFQRRLKDPHSNRDMFQRPEIFLKYDRVQIEEIKSEEDDDSRPQINFNPMQSPSKLLRGDPDTEGFSFRKQETTYDRDLQARKVSNNFLMQTIEPEDLPQQLSLNVQESNIPWRIQEQYESQFQHQQAFHQPQNMTNDQSVNSSLEVHIGQFSLNPQKTLKEENPQDRVFKRSKKKKKMKTTL